MSPPDKPGIPERFRRGVVEDVVTATGPHTPVPPRDRQPSRPETVEVEMADDRPSVVEFQRAVHAKYGKASFSGPAWVFLILAVFGALGVIIYQLARRPEASAQSMQCLTKDQFDESMRIRDERTSRRFDTLETDTSYLKVALRLLQDRQLPAK